MDDPLDTGEPENSFTWFESLILLSSHNKILTSLCSKNSDFTLLKEAVWLFSESLLKQVTLTVFVF